MKKLISVKTAGSILLVCLGLLALFHGLVLVRLLPSEIVWGGRAGGSAADLRRLESFALLVTLLFAFITAVRMGIINAGKYAKAAKIGALLIVAYMIVNTAANLASGVTLEKLIFTPLTLLMALCALRLALD